MSVVPNDVKSTNMQELKRSSEPAIHQLPVVRAGFESLQSFELLQRAAKALANSTLVPKDYQGNISNCMIAIELAQRIGASPLLTCQNLYVVYGRPAWSAKFLIACFNQCGRFSAIRYEWQGVEGKDSWGCRAWAVERSTNEKILGPVITIELAKKEGWYDKSGSKWKTIPGLMLMYRSAAWLVNTHAPELSMGINTTDEMGDVYDAAPDREGNFTVETDHLRNGVIGEPISEGEPPA